MANAWILNPLPIAAVTASSSALGAPENVSNDYRGVIWQSAGGSTAWMTLDLGSDVPLDTVELFGVALAPPGATLNVRAATNVQGAGFGSGAFWDSPAQPLYAGAVRLASGAGVSLWNAPADGRPTAARYVQLVFGGLGGAAVQIARAAAGQRVHLARNFSFGGAFGVRDLGNLDFSPRGVLLRRRGAKLRTVGISFDNALRDEVESAIQPMIEDVGTSEMIALVSDPAADDQRERRCYFGPLIGDTGTVQRTAVGWQWKCNMVSIF